MYEEEDLLIEKMVKLYYTPNISKKFSEKVLKSYEQKTQERLKELEEIKKKDFSNLNIDMLNNKVIRNRCFKSKNRRKVK